MADVYSLLTNQHVKSIICKYVVNSYEYKEYLLLKYFSEFFETSSKDFPLTYLDITLSNIRWYISESYLEDIRYLNGKVDLEIFWSKLQPYKFTGIFQTTVGWMTFLVFNDIYVDFELRFVLDNLGSFEEPSKELKCCFVYRENDKDVYRLSISHEYIESNFFDKLVDFLYYTQYVPILKLSSNRYYNNSTSLAKLYNTIAKLYKESPKDYKIENGFLVLNIPS